MLGNALLSSSVCGPIADLMKKLAGQDAQSWLENLGFFLRKERTWPPLEYTGKVFAKVQICGDSAAKLLRQIKDGGAIGIDEHTVGYIRKREHEFGNSCREYDAEFVCESLRYLLGVTGRTRTEMVLSRTFLAQHGLDLCSGNEALQLMMQCPEERFPEDAKFGTLPYASGHPSIPCSVLGIHKWKQGQRVPTLILSTAYLSSERVVDPDDVWIFRKLKKKEVVK